MIGIEENVDWVWTMDDDAVPEPNTLAELLEGLKKSTWIVRPRNRGKHCPIFAGRMGYCIHRTRRMYGWQMRRQWCNALKWGWWRFDPFPGQV